MRVNQNRDRRALVTGATGFVGSAVTRRLVSKGWDVSVPVRPSSNLELLSPVLDRLSFHTHDGSTAQLIQILAAARPQIVFHLASLFITEHQSDDLEPLIRSNVLFGAQLVEAMVRSGSHLLINTGTSWEHYQSCPYSPVNLYAATKRAFQDLLTFYVETTPLRALTLKLFDTYGPGDPRPKLMNLLVKAAMSATPLKMSPGEQKIDLVYIDDVVDAYLLAAGRLLEGEGDKGEEYAVSSGHAISLRQVVAILEEVAQCRLPIEWGGRPYRTREVMTPWQDGPSIPGWQAHTELTEGIRRVWESFSLVDGKAT